MVNDEASGNRKRNFLATKNRFSFFLVGIWTFSGIWEFWCQLNPSSNVVEFYVISLMICLLATTDERPSPRFTYLEQKVIHKISSHRSCSLKLRSGDSVGLSSNFIINCSNRSCTRRRRHISYLESNIRWRICDSHERISSDPLHTFRKLENKTQYVEFSLPLVSLLLFIDGTTLKTWRNLQDKQSVEIQKVVKAKQRVERERFWNQQWHRTITFR